ncbi:hypothetical protein Zmor_015034 [Zophobas morio]|uniref:DUF4806 domain-containing protein n=1 Tax=Zophobas morio TaxID=2755281 RepID=A0AA38MGS7_9CUCU|nr:hypothetical protein Zmor_015034 [Zophobas morio]
MSQEEKELLEERHWTVVEFTKDDDYREISCIPNNWVFSKNDEVFSFWPKRNIRKHIKNATPPEKQWDDWPARRKKDETIGVCDTKLAMTKSTQELNRNGIIGLTSPLLMMSTELLAAFTPYHVEVDRLSVRSLERNNNDSPATLSLGSEVNTSPQNSLIITEPCNVDDQIVDKLNEIIRKTTRVEIMVKRLLQKISNDPTHTPLHNTDSISNTCIQPFTKYRLLCEYEERLKSGEDARKELDNIFRLCGGNSTKENIKRGLRRIFDDKLARKCSWLGRKNNFQVSNLIIMDVLKNAVRKNFPLLTDKIFELTVSTWLRQANLRFTRKLEK